MKEYIGNLHAKDAHVAIVVARFNEIITKNLLQGSLDALKRHGVDEKNISVAWVPGCFEIPLVAKRLALSNKFDAVICLGALIKGATSHFDLVAGQTTSGIGQASLESGIPVIYAILTTDNIEQAVERSGSKAGNIGFDYAMSAIEMINLMKQLP